MFESKDQSPFLTGCFVTASAFGAVDGREVRSFGVVITSSMPKPELLDDCGCFCDVVLGRFWSNQSLVSTRCVGCFSKSG